MRPWFQPFIYYKIINFFKIIYFDNPFIWTTLLRIISSAIGYLSILYLFFVFKDFFFKKYKIFNYLLFFTFWFYPFLHSRISSENLSISLFIISFCALFQILVIQKKKFNLIIFCVSSFLMGLSMVVKFTTVFTAFPFFLWLVFFRFNFFRILIFGIFILAALSLGLFIDYINWGTFKNTYYQFYIHNLSSGVIGRMKYFGVDPWYYYFFEIVKQLAPLLSLFFLIGLIFFWIKNIKHVLTWITLVTFIIFSLIGHKEIRYIFPIYIFAPFFISYLIDHIKFKTLRILIQYVVIFSNIVFLSLTLFFPANSKVGVYNFLYKKYDGKTPIYYTDENPYQVNNMEPFFYTKFLPKIEKFNNYEANSNKFIIITKSNEFSNEIKYDCTIIYSTYPIKIINLNNNWKRLKLNWKVYKCSGN